MTIKIKNGVTIFTFTGGSLPALDSKLNKFEEKVKELLENGYFDGLKIDFDYIGCGEYNGYVYQRVRIKSNKEALIEINE